MIPLLRTGHHTFYSFSIGFFKAFVLPCCPMQPRYLCACVSLIICLSIRSGIYSLFCHFPLNAQFDSTWELRSPLADLLSWPDQNIKLTVWEKQYFTPVLTCSNLFKPFHTCSHLFTMVHTCSHLSNYLRSSQNHSFSLNFSLPKAVIFQSYVLSCWNCKFFAHLIKSFPTVYCLCSCIEIKMSILLAAHT